MILRASQETSAAIQEKTGSKVIAQIVREENQITNKDMEELLQIQNIASFNRLSKQTAIPVNFHVITKNDTKEERSNVTLLSYDDLEKDSAFTDGTYRLMVGSYVNEDHPVGVVMNSLLAEANGLNLNDEVELASNDKQTVTVKIIGMYQSGSERKQEASLLSTERIENQVFIDNKTYAELFENVEFYSVSVYAKDPEQLDNLKLTLETIINDKAELTTSDAMFQQLSAPLNQIIKITSLIRMLTLITGFVIISLLLCMWMRTRQKEVAIFISLGKTKTSMFLQVLLETTILFFISVLTACVVGMGVAMYLPSILSKVETIGTTISVVVTMPDITVLFGLGSVVMVLAVGCSLLPIIRVNPKTTLSRMEG